MITSSIVVIDARQPAELLLQNQSALGPRLRLFLLNLYGPSTITGLPNRDLVSIAEIKNLYQNTC